MSGIDALKASLAEAGRVIVAYSGGVDSAFLADVAHEVLEDDALAVTAVSPSLAPRERVAAIRLATDRGWRHVEVRTDEHMRPGYRANGLDRCYHCKDALFDVLDSLSSIEGRRISVGTNLDDLREHRPGLRAVAEHGVAQPLVDAGFTKLMIREAAAARGLPVAAKPATPCLASRIAYGVVVTPERLTRVARAEELIWALGVGDVRVRDLGGRARIDVPRSDIGLVQGSVLDEIRSLGFTDVVVHPGGLMSGSMLTLVEPLAPHACGDVARTSPDVE